MNGWITKATILLALVAAAGACGPAGPSRTRPAAEAEPARVAKRITASIMGEPVSFINRVNPTQISIPGVSVLEQLVNASLSELNAEKRLQPLLAEGVPSVERGTWQVFSDGRMETTWRIRPGARWHDGAPVTGEDFVFTAAVDQDREMPIAPRPAGYGWVDRVEAPDARTVKVTWSRPYIDADAMFSPGFSSPYPKHLLEETFVGDKARLLALPYWRQEFVGTGPFAVREVVSGSSILLQAYEQYALGRAKIDEVEVRFILDLNALMTNVVAGAVELTLGRGFTVDQAVQLRDQWRDGTMRYEVQSWIAIHPQFISPSPPIVGDVQFRRALMHATDRQELVDSLQQGLGAVAHMYLAPSQGEYNEVEGSAVRYEYDPRRAAQLMEGLGYTKGVDGIYRDPAGERLGIELRSNAEKITDNAIVPVADFWRRLGVAAEPVPLAPQRTSDREYLATFPAFRMMRQPNEPADVDRLHSSVTPLPENRYVGRNYARYINPELDASIDRYLSTIPWNARMQALRAVVRHVSENLSLMGLFYDLGFSFFSNRLVDVGARESQVWDVHRWDLRS